MPGKPPAFRFLTKDPGDETLHEIGVAWNTSKADVFSVSLDLENTGERINFTMIPNKPKPKTQPAGGLKPAA